MDFYRTITGYVCKKYGKMVKQWIGGHPILRQSHMGHMCFCIIEERLIMVRFVWGIILKMPSETLFQDVLSSIF